MPTNEKNEVRMIGVLPSQGADPIPVGKIPDDGNQIAVRQTPTNATLVLHTVTVGKTFYLTACVLDSNATGVGTGYLFVSNAADVVQYIMLYHIYAAAGTGNSCLPLFTPIEIPETWKVKVVSTAVTVEANAFIHGYEM